MANVRLVLMTVITVGLSCPAAAEPKPLKVYILAGQSNMEGHARVETFDYIGVDPATAPLLKAMRGPDGKAPIGKGTWKHRLIGKGTVKYKTDWPQGEFILMRTTFEVDNLDYEAYRISVLACQGFHVYLNGHKINTYIWWKDEPQYRPIPLEPQYVKYLRIGKNCLAIYANAEYDRRTEACFATRDLMIEGISEAGLAYVNSEAYRDKQMHKVCTPEEAKIIRGCSNAGYHYLGSGKIMAQIGKAFAEAMLGMEKN